MFFVLGRQREQTTQHNTTKIGYRQQYRGIDCDGQNLMLDCFDNCVSQLFYWVFMSFYYFIAYFITGVWFEFYTTEKSLSFSAVTTNLIL